MSLEGIKIDCVELRGEINDVSIAVKALMEDNTFKGEQRYPDQHSEMSANIMLAYRHLEDARMRLGKVIQAYEGGVSVFDK